MDDLATTVGVELEFNGLSLASPRTFVCDELKTSGLTGWQVKTDRSCGYELVSPILRSSEDVDSLCLAVDKLRTAGARVDDRCGMHVHLGVQGLTKSQVYNLVAFMVRYQESFFKLTEKIRHHNPYCRPATAEFVKRAKLCLAYGASADLMWQGERGDLKSDRYLWVNGVSIRTRGTLEVRLMSSTLDSSVVRGWVDLLLQVVSVAKSSCQTERQFKFSTTTGSAQLSAFLSELSSGCSPGVEMVRRWVRSRYAVLARLDGAPG